MMRFNKPRPHSFVLSIYVLIVLVGFSALLLVWSYYSGIRALDKELTDAFEQRRTVGEIILEHQLDLVDMALKEILDNPLLLDAVARKDKAGAQRRLLSAIDRNTSLYLDIGFINLTDRAGWVDASSSFYDFDLFFPLIPSGRIPEDGVVFRPDTPQKTLTLILKQSQIIQPVTGKVLGSLVGGFVLDNHLELMKKIQAKTHSTEVALFSDGHLIGASAPFDDTSVAMLARAYPTLSRGDYVSDQGLIAGVQPIHIHGRKTALEIMIAISDDSYQQLKKTYQVKTLIMLILALVFSAVSAWVVRRMITPSLRRLLTYSGKITSGDTRAVYEPGMLTELNQVGHSMETMVGSLADANRELVYLRNYLSNIIDSMPSILVGINTAGQVTQWSRKAVEITGISQEKALDAPLTTVLPRLAGQMDRIETAIKQRRPQTLPKTPYYADHDLRYEDITIYPLTANGAEGAVIRIDEVTDTVRMEERMVQSEKMLSVGGLAAGMAHEINNPLAGMIQTADTLQKRLTLDLPANLKAAGALGTDMETIKAFMETRKIPRMLETIRTSGLRAADIVTNMLSFARKGDSGMLPNNLADLMDETLVLAESDYDLKKKYDFRQVKVIRNYHEDMPQVPCEPGKIQQVFLNILTNGAQAMCGYKETGPEDYVPEFFISIRPDRDGTMACIEIEDNGPGMDGRTRKRVFEPFFTTKPEGEGTGLGLSVSYFIVKENHNGVMSVSSTPGAGTSFLIKLPMTRHSSPDPISDH
ncbi:MAG: ATP-binding protein [Desulfobacter sp.]